MKPQVKIAVVAAILIDHRYPKKVFIAERSDGSGWEFPGGKVNVNECHQDALKREIREELDMEIEVAAWIGQSSVDVKEKKIVMDAYLAFCDRNKLVLNEHLQGKWIRAEEMCDFRWAPADVPLLSAVEAYLMQGTIPVKPM